MDGFDKNKKIARVITGIVLALGLLTSACSAALLGGATNAVNEAANSQPSASQTEEEATPDESEVEEPATEETAAAESDTEESAADEETTDPEPPAETQAEDIAEPDAPAAGPSIGDTVEVGDFEVTVTEVESGLTSIGEDFLEEEPQGQYVVVRVEVTNNGNSPEYFFDSEQYVIDEDDRQHSTSSDFLFLDEENLFLTEINPGNKAVGSLLYDIPADATPVALDSSAGFFSEPVRISLLSE